MARSFGTQTAAQRRAAQRRTAAQLKRGEKPLGGKYGAIVRQARIRGNKQRAYDNIRNQLGTYLKYDDGRVRHYVYDVMTEDDLIWVQDADAEQIRERARQGQKFGDQYVVIVEDQDINPFWYH